MSKKIFHLFLLMLFAAVSGFAQAEKKGDEVSAARWESFCKSKPEKCRKAEMMCERFENIDCDEIRASFIKNTQIPSLRKNPQ